MAAETCLNPTRSKVVSPIYPYMLLYLSLNIHIIPYIPIPTFRAEPEKWRLLHACSGGNLCRSFSPVCSVMVQGLGFRAREIASNHFPRVIVGSFIEGFVALSSQS